MTTSTRSTPATLRSRHASARLFTALVAAGLASTVAQAQTAITLASGLTGKSGAPTTNASTSGFTSGSQASGSTTGTFLDISLAASNSTGAALGAGNSGDTLTLANGFVGTSSDFSINQLIFTNTVTSGLTGAGYANTTTPSNPASVKTLTLGSGGMTNSSATKAVNLDTTLTIDTGSTTQTWTAGTQLLSVYGNVKGTGTINISGTTVTLRNPGTSDFSGTWVVGGSSAILATRGNGAALGTGKVLLQNSGTLGVNRFAGSGSATVANNIVIGSGGTGGTLQVGTNTTATFTGSISNDTAAVTTPIYILKFTAAGNGTTIANVSGDLSGHVGNMFLGGTVSSGGVTSDATGFTANFTSTSTLSFSIGANKLVDTIDTTTNALIRAGSTGVNVTTVGFNGKFSIDLTGANTTTGNSWNLVDAVNLNESYGSNFSVSSTALEVFTNSGGVWSLTKAGSTWSYDQSTGALSVAASAVPEPATYAALAGLGILGFAVYRRRKQS